jgi:hypothetical protein
MPLRYLEPRWSLATEAVAYAPARRRVPTWSLFYIHTDSLSTKQGKSRVNPPPCLENGTQANEKGRTLRAAPTAQSTSHQDRKRRIAPAPLVCSIIILLVLAVALALGEKGTRYFVKVESLVKWNIVGCIGLPTRSVTRRQRCWHDSTGGVYCAPISPAPSRLPQMERDCGSMRNGEDARGP